MPKRTDIHKILVIGSGPIVIGQAAEFDYSGNWETTSISYNACFYANNCRKSIRRKVSQSNPSAPITKERKG